MSQNVTLTVFTETGSREVVLKGEGDTYHLNSDDKGITLESVEA